MARTLRVLAKRAHGKVVEMLPSLEDLGVDICVLRIVAELCRGHAADAVVEDQPTARIDTGVLRPGYAALQCALLVVTCCIVSKVVAADIVLLNVVLLCCCIGGNLLLCSAAVLCSTTQPSAIGNPTISTPLASNWSDGWGIDTPPPSPLTDRLTSAGCLDCSWYCQPYPHGNTANSNAATIEDCHFFECSEARPRRAG